MLDMCKRNNNEPDEYLVVKDLIDFTYINFAYPYIQVKHVCFVLFYFIPMLISTIRVFKDSYTTRILMGLAMIT
jgi:hypothetical protein